MTVEKKEMDSFVVNFYIQSGKRSIRIIVKEEQ